MAHEQAHAWSSWGLVEASAISTKDRRSWFVVVKGRGSWFARSGSSIFNQNMLTSRFRVSNWNFQRWRFSVLKAVERIMESFSQNQLVNCARSLRRPARCEIHTVRPPIGSLSNLKVFNRMLPTEYLKLNVSYSKFPTVGFPLQVSHYELHSMKSPIESLKSRVSNWKSQWATLEPHCSAIRLTRVNAPLPSGNEVHSVAQ